MDPEQHSAYRSGASGEGATVMTRTELIRLRRQMQQRISDVVAERRIAVPDGGEPANDEPRPDKEAHEAQERAA
jgi:hypothetical protein